MPEADLIKVRPARGERSIRRFDAEEGHSFLLIRVPKAKEYNEIALEEAFHRAKPVVSSLMSFPERRTQFGSDCL